MSGDFLETVLGDAEPEAPVEAEPVTPESVVQEAVTPPEPEAPVVEAAPEHVKPEPGFVPISALMDERDKRKAAEERAKQFAPKPEAAIVPDPLDDPVAYNAYMGQQLEARVAQERFNMSNIMASQTHGEDTVKAAIEWAGERAAQDPAFAVSYMREAHPIDWIVRQHKQSSLLSEIGDNVDDWFVREAAKRGYAMAPAPVAAAPIIQAAVQPVSRPAAPPRSIASDVSASAPVATDPKAEFEAIFNGR